MNRNAALLVTALFAAGLILSTGCSKKTVSPGDLPPGASAAGGAGAGGRGLGESGLAGGAGRGVSGPKTPRSQLPAEIVRKLEALKIYFEYDSFELKGESRDKLQSAAEIMKTSAPGAHVVIEGHTDERGTDEYNLALGERRARSVYEYMTVLGVAGERMKMVSYGEEQPAEAGGSESAFTRNRRVEFKVLE